MNSNLKEKIIKILIIVKNIDGGTGTFVLNLLKINRLNIYGSQKIKVLALEHPSYRNDDYSDFNFLRPKKFYPQTYSFSIHNFINILHELIWVVRNVYKFKPNVIFGIDFRCNLLATISKLFFYQTKVVLTTHIDLAFMTINRSNRLVKEIFKLITRFFYDRADALVCVSRNLASNLKSDVDIKKNVRVIYNGMDFKTSRPKLFPKNKKVIIVSVARLSIQKDYPTLIKAVGLLNNKYNNYELRIASDGPEKQNLKDLVKKLGLVKRIKFLGWVKSVDTLLNKSDIFVLSSKAEGFGYVLLEAMSHGLPVVSTDSPHGPSEVLENGKYGLLVPVGDEIKLCKAISILMSNKLKYEYFSKLSFRRSLYFSESKMLNAYSKLFVNLTKTRS